jgi:hypothetical protein
MSKANTKVQRMTGTLSTESILITVESNWVQTKTVIWFVLFLVFCLNETNQTNQINQINRKGLIPPTEVPSPGLMEPSCRLRVMFVMVSQLFGAKTEQRDETSADYDAGCRQRHEQ